MKNQLLMAAGLFTMVSWAHAQSDTLRYDNQRMDSLVLVNLGSEPIRIDSIALSRIQGSAKAYFLEFSIADSLYLKSFGFMDPDQEGLWTGSRYARYRGATIPAGGSRTFRGQVVDIPHECPCEDAGVFPEPHLFKLEFIGSEYRVASYLQGDVKTRSWMEVKHRERSHSAGVVHRHVRADGKAVGKDRPFSQSFRTQDR